MSNFQKFRQIILQDWQLFLENVWYDRRPFYTPEDTAAWQRHSIGLHWGILFIGMVTFLWSPMPADDLLRHIHAIEYGYDYRQMFDGYPYGFDAWYLFDVAAGHLYQLFGVAGIKLIQALSVMLFAYAIALNLPNVHPDWRLFIVLMLVWLVGPRFLTGRPTMFETGLMFLAMGLSQHAFRPWLAHSLHLLIGFVMVSFYHLFFIYLLPLLLWRKIYAIPLVVGAIAWQGLTGGEYVKEVWEILTFGNMRLPEVKVSENASGLGIIIITALGLLLFVRQWTGVTWRYLLTFGWFSLPMQVRYVSDNLIPIAVVLLARQWQLRPHPYLLLLGFVMVKFAMGGGALWLVENKKQESQHLAYFSKNDHVLADSLGTNFWVVHHGAVQHVKVAPAMEIGFAEKSIQQINVDQKLSCQLLHQYGFTKVVERGIANLPLPCLKLVASTPQGYKIWQVVP